jgi:hypothetical protein
MSEDNNLSPNEPQPEPSESAPTPETRESLKAQYDRIYANIVETDTIARRLRAEIFRRDEKVKFELHMRKLAWASLRIHHQQLRHEAIEELRKLTGLRALPGFRHKKDTQAQVRAKLEYQRRAIEAQIKQADERSFAASEFNNNNHEKTENQPQ